MGTGGRTGPPKTPIEEIEFFFAPPDPPFQGGKTRSVLYLLRSDIIDIWWGKRCLRPKEAGLTADDFSSLQGPLFPPTLTIFAGIDLLAKFYAGSDQGRVGTRFKEFLKYGGIGKVCAERKAIWSVRNSLMHSFGLYDKDGKKPIQIDTTDGGAPVTCEGGKWMIHVPNLYIGFRDSIYGYYKELLQKAKFNPGCPRLGNFKKIYKDYGSLSV